MNQFLRKQFGVWIGAFALLVATGCATVDPCPAEAPWTPSELSYAVAGGDPIEPFNRCMFFVTDAGMTWVIDPLGRVYTTILPRPVIEKLHNACLNLEFPARAVSCLGMGEFKGSWDELCRFLINSTVGVAGLFDPAAHWFEIYSTDSDFGQMFASWGIPPGCIFVLPLMPTLNVRDTVGYVFDTAFDGKTYIPYAGSATALNRGVMAHRSYTQIVEGSSDKYKTYTEMALLRRQLQLRMYFYRVLNEAAEAQRQGIIYGRPDDVPELPRPEELPCGNWETIPGYCPQTPILDTIRVAMFQAQNDDDPWFFRLSLFNSDFTKKRSTRKIRLADDLPKMKYGYWKANPRNVEENCVARDKIMILLPGIGGNYFSPTPTAFAELFYDCGWSVAVLDSSFTWQFLLASGCELPGYLPRDAQHMRRAVGLVLEDLKCAGKLAADADVTLLGYSFGALHTLKISALEEEEPTLGVSRYVAINPPVDLEYAMRMADRLACTGADWCVEEVVDNVTDAAGKALMKLEETYPYFDPAEAPRDNPYDYSVPLDELQADYLAALYFKMSMRGLLFTAHRERGLPAIETPYRWGSRTGLYREIDRFTFRDYTEKVIAPELAPIELDEIYRQSNLRAFGESLARNPKVRVLHTVNDFLLSPEDRVFLDRTLGDRLTWFDRGGHLGNLYICTVQRKILEMAEPDLCDAPETVWELTAPTPETE